MMFRYRYNRATYFAYLAIFVAVMAVLVNVMEKPPGQGELVLVLLAIPRLHDLGRSGWWAALPIAAEIVLFIVLVQSGLSIEDIKIAAGLIAIAFLIGMIVLGLIPGQKQANQYGEPPPAGVNWRVRR